MSDKVTLISHVLFVFDQVHFGNEAKSMARNLQKLKTDKNS